MEVDEPENRLNVADSFGHRPCGQHTAFGRVGRHAVSIHDVAEIQYLISK